MHYPFICAFFCGDDTRNADRFFRPSLQRCPYLSGCLFLRPKSDDSPHIDPYCPQGKWVGTGKAAINENNTESLDARDIAIAGSFMHSTWCRRTMAFFSVQHLQLGRKTHYQQSRRQLAAAEALRFILFFRVLPKDIFQFSMPTVTESVSEV
jgi:hypothetical protein